MYGRFETLALFDVVVDAGGVANVGWRHWETGAFSHVGVAVGVNSGRPLGACGLSNGTVTALHGHHRSPEEDVRRRRPIFFPLSRATRRSRLI